MAPFSYKVCCTTAEKFSGFISIIYMMTFLYVLLMGFRSLGTTEVVAERTEFEIQFPPTVQVLWGLVGVSFGLLLYIGVFNKKSLLLTLWLVGQGFFVLGFIILFITYGRELTKLLLVAGISCAFFLFFFFWVVFLHRRELIYTETRGHLLTNDLGVSE